MSGHSKWSSIKHKKGAADAKRGNIFTKLSRNITLAAKELGGDLDTNFKLRLAIDKAKSLNMPKDNIERAIKRGTGELAGAQVEEVIYEAFGPEGSSIVIEAVTDNKNRTVSNIKTILNKNNGSLAGSNSVLWMFERKGVLNIPKLSFTTEDNDEIEISLIDMGAEDIVVEGDNFKVVCTIDDLKKMQESLKQDNIEPDDVFMGFVSKEKGNISDNGKNKLMRLLEKLEEDDDVNNLYTNIDF